MCRCGRGGDSGGHGVHAGKYGGLTEVRRSGAGWCGAQDASGAQWGVVGTWSPSAVRTLGGTEVSSGGQY